MPIFAGLTKSGKPQPSCGLKVKDVGLATARQRAWDTHVLTFTSVVLNFLLGIWQGFVFSDPLRVVLAAVGGAESPPFRARGKFVFAVELKAALCTIELNVITLPVLTPQPIDRRTGFLVQPFS